MKIGASLQARRKARGFTLEDLAGRSGVSRAMISEIERDTKSPTVRVLAQIARGLECSITELLASATDQAVEHLDEEAYQRVTDPESGTIRESLAPRLTRHGIDFVRYTLPPKAQLCNCPPRPASDLVSLHVAKGALSVRIGDRTMEVGQGETITYVSDVETDLVNASRGETVVFMLLDASRSKA